MPASISDLRARACTALLRDVHAITARDGNTPSALHAIKLKLVALAKKRDLFPAEDFAMPVAQSRTHKLLVEDNDGLGLYLTISLAGKQAAPHDHGIWCVNAAIAGQERHCFWRRTDDGARPGQATVIQTGESVIAPGTGMAMSDHDIHSTEVVGTEPFFGLALYGYALPRFPSVAHYHPSLGTVRTTASRRHMAPA